MKDHGGAGIHPVGHWRPIDGAGGYALRKATGCGEPLQEHIPVRISGPMGDPYWSNLLLKDWTTWKGAIPEQCL